MGWPPDMAMGFRMRRGGYQRKTILETEARNMTVAAMVELEKRRLKKPGNVVT
jgi:hypothetical protein